MFYDTECWTVKSLQERKLSVAHIRMLRWMSSHTRQCRFCNECIKEKVGVTPIKEEMVESRLKWFSHVRRVLVALVRKVDQMDDSPIVNRGRQRKTISETIEKDLELTDLSKDAVYDVTQWQCQVYVFDSNQWEKALLMLLLLFSTKTNDQSKFLTTSCLSPKVKTKDRILYTICDLIILKFMFMHIVFHVSNSNTQAASLDGFKDLIVLLN